MNDDIIFLIARKLNREASEKELEQLQSWITAAPGNLEEYEVFVKIWEETKNTISGGNHFDTEAAWAKVDPLSPGLQRASSPAEAVAKAGLLPEQERTSPLKPSRKRILFMPFERVAVAAAILLVAGVGGFWLRSYLSVQSVVAAANQTIRLPDGSTVIMRKGSDIRYAKVFDKDERLVTLHGEAFFRVVHNPQQPFHVLTDRADVKVTGTAFLVRSGDSTDEVMVASGTVNVSDKLKTGAQVTLTAGKQVTLQSSRFQEAQVTDSNYLAWNTGILDFHNTSMTMALADMERYYGIPIEAAGNHKADIDKIHITVRFRNQPLEEALEEITLITGLQVKRENKKIIFDLK